MLTQHAPQLADWAVGAAQPFNRAPLWRRLLAIIQRTGVVGTQLLGSHAERFAQEVEAARHGHAHGHTSRSLLESESNPRACFSQRTGSPGYSGLAYSSTLASSPLT